MVASPGGVDPLAGAADAARRSSKLPTDKSYDYLRCRRYLAQRGLGVWTGGEEASSSMRSWSRPTNPASAAGFGRTATTEAAARRPCGVPEVGHIT